MKRQITLPRKNCVGTAAMILFLLLFCACHAPSTIQLLPAAPNMDAMQVGTGQSIGGGLPDLPQNATESEARIRRGFEMLALDIAYSARLVASPPFTFDFGELAATSPFTLEVAATAPTTTAPTTTAPTTGRDAMRLYGQEWEFIHTGTNVAGDSSMWFNSGSGWQELSNADGSGFGIFIAVMTSNPYTILWDPPAGLQFSSQAIGYEMDENRVVEVYEVQRQQAKENGTIDTLETTFVRLDSQSGLPVQTVSENMTITYNIDSRIIVEPPCLGERCSSPSE